MRLSPATRRRRAAPPRYRQSVSEAAAWPAALLLALAFLGCSGHSLPAIPEPVLDGFDGAVQDQLRMARAHAEGSPQDATAVGQYGRVLYAYGQHRAAADAFERCRGLEPEGFDWTYLLGVARADLGQFEQARSVFESAIALRPDDLPVALRLADVLEQAGEFADARRVIERIDADSPDAAAALYRLGRLAAPDDPGLAVRHLEAALEIEPDYREAVYTLASAYRTMGREAEAAQQLARYERMSPVQRRHYSDPLLDAMDSIRAGSAQQVFNEGHALQQQGDLDGARARFDSVLEISPDHVQAHVNLVAVHGGLGNYEESARHYRRAVELDASIAEAHYNHGVSRHFAEDYEEAASAFRKAIEINPQHADAYGNLATTLDALGRRTEAARHYRSALDLNPGHPMANFHLGRQLAEAGQYRQSLPYLQRAVATESPGTALHAYLLALVYRQLGQPEQSATQARLALQHATRRGATDLAARIRRELDP